MPATQSPVPPIPATIAARLVACSMNRHHTRTPQNTHTRTMVALSRVSVTTCQRCACLALSCTDGLTNQYVAGDVLPLVVTCAACAPARALVAPSCVKCHGYQSCLLPTSVTSAPPAHLSHGNGSRLHDTRSRRHCAGLTALAGAAAAPVAAPAAVAGAAAPPLTTAAAAATEPPVPAAAPPPLTAALPLAGAGAAVTVAATPAATGGAAAPPPPPAAASPAAACVPSPRGDIARYSLATCGATEDTHTHAAIRRTAPHHTAPRGGTAGSCRAPMRAPTPAPMPAWAAAVCTASSSASATASWGARA